MNLRLPLILVVLLLNFAFLIPEKVNERANKVIAKFYNIETFSKEVIEVSDLVNSNTASEFKEQNLFKIVFQSDLLGYAYIGKAPSKTASFDYIVLFDTNFIIQKSKVLIYREEYGGEIGSKRWLRQFNGKSSRSGELIYNQDIIPISGATISVRSMTKAINDLLESIVILQNNKEI
jgi:hypothetical protein